MGERTGSGYPLACPVCERRLERDYSTFRCPTGHTFDLAKEGYINLLPPQHRTRGVDGDEPVMLRARRRFLETGHYLPLRSATISMTARILEARDFETSHDPRPPCVLEVGCGDGYYIGGLAPQLPSSTDAVLLGADLSKHAAKVASKRYPVVLFFVADTNRRLYVEPNSVAVLLDVFAPRNPLEFARVLEPGGSALIAIPTDSHLAGLRNELGLIGIQDDKEQRVLGRFSDDFTLESRLEIEFPIRLTPNAVQDLVEMGPNYWHRPTRSVPVIGTSVDTQASFVLLHLRKIRDA
ncbi:MAG: methyltransferase type 11 [Actinomycetota bacterium]|nr:methyltransferase type 11 [Actinomycetota bacterium]